MAPLHRAVIKQSPESTAGLCEAAASSAPESLPMERVSAATACPLASEKMSALTWLSIATVHPAAAFGLYNHFKGAHFSLRILVVSVTALESGPGNSLLLRLFLLFSPH